MSSLYNLSAEVAELKEKLEASDLDAQTIHDTLEAESFDFEEKCKAVAYVIKEFAAKEELLTGAIDEMVFRKNAMKNKVTALQSYLLDCMKLAGVAKVPGVEFDISVRKNPPSVEVYESGLIPEQYWKVPEPPPATVNKKLVMEALKEGREIPGARISQTERVVIK